MLATVTHYYRLPPSSIKGQFGHAGHKKLDTDQSHATLARTLLDLSPEYKEIPKSVLLPVENVPEPIRDVFSKSLHSISPQDLKKYTQQGLIGLLEEIADVVHGTTLLLSRQTNLFNEQNAKKFSTGAEAILKEEPRNFAKKIWTFSKNFVDTLSWKTNKILGEFIQQNGLKADHDINLPTGKQIPALSKQLHVFLSSDFIDSFIRKRNQFPGVQGMYTPQENVKREMDELEERIDNFVKNPDNANKANKVTQSFSKLKTVFNTYCTDVNPKNAHAVYTSLASLIKTLFGLKHFSVTELFEFMLQKQVYGRGGGIYLDKIHHLNGQEGYNQGKAIIKPVQYINEAAKVKELLHRQTEMAH